MIRLSSRIALGAALALAIAGSRIALAGQVPGAATASDTPVSSHDRTNADARRYLVVAASVSGKPGTVIQVERKESSWRIVRPTTRSNNRTTPVSKKHSSA